MYSDEKKDLSLYRLFKAGTYLQDAQKTLELEMYETAANRSYYAISMPPEQSLHWMVWTSKNILV